MKLVRKPSAWHFETPVGTFRIAPARSGNGRWDLWIGAECLGTYESTAATADAVETHATGWIEWDEFHHRDSEAKPGKWKVGPPPDL